MRNDVKDESNYWTGIPTNTPVCVGIRPRGIVLANYETKAVLPRSPDEPHEYDFNKIVTWGVSTEYFVLVLKNPKSSSGQSKFYFKTTQVIMETIYEKYFMYLKYINLINYRENR